MLPTPPRHLMFVGKTTTLLPLLTNQSSVSQNTLTHVGYRPRRIALSILPRSYASGVFLKPKRSSEFKIVCTNLTFPLTLTAGENCQEAHHQCHSLRFRYDCKVDKDDIAFFETALGKGNVLQSETDLAGLNEDWMGKYQGESRVALKPNTTEQVSQILAYCNQKSIAVVPQGGNTGLVGGSVPVHDEVILNMSRMNRIRSFDSASGVLAVDAGAILQNVDEYLVEREHIFPLDLGAKGSCHVGGNVATNAGGIRYIRYGSLHGNVLGLEVVLADGKILDTLSTLRKDNTGYDVKQLFIGSEGSLGVITGLSILCPPRPKSVNVVFLAVPSFENCQKILTAAKQQLGEILSAYEFLDELSYEMVLTVQHERVRHPLSSGEKSPFYVLFETHGSNQAHDKEKVTQFLENLIESELVSDGVVAQDETQAKALWFIRESVPESISKSGKVYKYDISIPVTKMYDVVLDVRQKLKDRPAARVAGYGHLGDSNLHLNICEPSYTSETLNAIEPYVYEWTASVGGSVSAEHGVGVMKPNHLHYSKSQTAIDMMKAIKTSLDPNGILNPYKVLPKL